MADSILIYGSSGATKTTQCGEFHRYFFERAKALNLPNAGFPGWHVTGDSTFEPISDLIAAGQVLPWNIAYEAELGGTPISALLVISSGMVPKHVDPLTGRRLSNEWEYARNSISIEGLHVIGELLKFHLMSEHGLVNGAVTDRATGHQIGTAGLQIYDMVKNNLHIAVTRMRGLRHISATLWTTHEAKGTDQYSAGVLGPAILVNKGIDKVPGWFAHTLRLRPFQYQLADGSTDTARALYFEPHLDQQTGLFWPTKTSLTPPKLVALRTRSKQVGADGSFLPTIIQPDGKLVGGIWEFLRNIERG